MTIESDLELLSQIENRIENIKKNIFDNISRTTATKIRKPNVNNIFRAFAVSGISSLIQYSNSKKQSQNQILSLLSEIIFKANRNL